VADLPLDLPAACDARGGGQRHLQGYDVPYGKIMATATLIVVPVLIFALIASKQLVRGLTMGAVK
jgi:ABC-type glycerol-3-phosphate transport system permease component